MLQVVEQIAADVENWLDYILNQPASEKKCFNGIRDEGRASVTLDYFITHPKAVEAHLEPAHVVALRFYTTHAFKYLNGPLRSDLFGQGKWPHPLPITLTYISEGIKKLRAVYETQSSAAKVTVTYVTCTPH